MSRINTSMSKKKEEEKEKKFLGLLSYKLDYDFDKNAVSECLLQRGPKLRWIRTASVLKSGSQSKFQSPMCHGAFSLYNLFDGIKA
jgi:hypothetical protein